MMSTHILEVLSCASALLREQYRKIIEKAGATVVDEKVDYKTESIKFYLDLKTIDLKTEESLVKTLKASPVFNGAYLVRISRGTDKTKNIL